MCSGSFESRLSAVEAFILRVRLQRGNLRTASMINRGPAQSPTTLTRGRGGLRASTITVRGVIPRASTTVSAGMSPREPVAGEPGAARGRCPGRRRSAPRSPVAADLHDLHPGAHLHPGLGEQFQEHAPVDEVEVEGGLGQHLDHDHLSCPAALDGERSRTPMPPPPATTTRSPVSARAADIARPDGASLTQTGDVGPCRFGAHRYDQPVGVLGRHGRGIGRHPQPHLDPKNLHLVRRKRRKRFISSLKAGPAAAIRLPPSQ